MRITPNIARNSIYRISARGKSLQRTDAAGFAMNDSTPSEPYMSFEQRVTLSHFTYTSCARRRTRSLCRFSRLTFQRVQN
jgi:hypothetical protein